MASQWCVVHTKPRSEQKALKNLQNQGFVCWLPLIDVEKVQAGQLTVKQEPLFPRYLFVRIDQELGNWSSIRSTQGVHHLLRFGQYLSTVSDETIEALRLTILQAVVKPLFELGDAVRVMGGAFKGFIGHFQNLIQMPSGEMRAMVLLEVLAKQQALTMRLTDLKLAAKLLTTS